jgi:gas vesicle protein
MADFDRYDNEGSGAGFMMGLLTGTVLGAGLGMLLAPKAGSELRSDLLERGREMVGKGREFVGQERERIGSDLGKSPY